MGMINQTNVTLENIQEIINITTGDPIEFMLNINTLVYGGWFFFILLSIVGILLFRKAQQRQDQPLVNIMYITTGLTIVSFFMRALFLIKDGVYFGMLTDFQLWIFPLIAVITAVMVKANG